MSGLLALHICVAMAGFVVVKAVFCPKDCYCREHWLWSRTVFVVSRYYRNMSAVPDLSQLSTISLPIYLKLSYANLTRVTKRDFPPGLRTNFLNLGGNRRLVVDDDAFSNMRDTLIYLDLESTRTFFNSTLKFLRGLSKLETLILSFNNIYEYRVIAPDVKVNLFAGLGLSSLKKLKMYKCDMTSIAARVFQDVGAVEELDLAANSLNAVPDAIATLNNLKTLDLSNSQFEVIRSRTFFQNKQLETLTMIQTKVKSVDEDAFEGLENSLEKLDLRDAFLTQVPGAALKSLLALKILKLDGNKINSVSPGSLSGSCCLHTLSLSRMNLTFNDGMFEGQENCIEDLVLREVNLAAIPLLPLTTLHKLRNLFLDGNMIQELKPKSLDGIKAKVFVFSSNPLKRIEKGAFDGTAIPLHLYIDITHMTNLTFVLDYPKGTFHTLDVSGLPIPCDCVTARVIKIFEDERLLGTCSNKETGADIGLQTDTVYRYLSRKCPGMLATSRASATHGYDAAVWAVCVIGLLSLYGNQVVSY